MKFKIYTLGCKVNQYESGRLGARLRAEGYASSDGGADLVYVNSCAVTAKARRKTQETLKKAARENPGAKIRLIGCSARLDGLVREAPAAAGPALSDNLGRKGRYFIKVQDGCDQFCSYCIIPHVRGPLKSRPADEVVREIGLAVTAGYREAEICGIHLGRYGRERGDRDGLRRLIERVLSETGIKQLRLSSLEINELTDGTLRLFMDDRRLVRRLHLPLQSGSDKILKAMNRPYKAKEYHERCLEIKERMPDAAVSTDVIVGFPGETEDDFRSTVRLVKALDLCKVHVFPFSAHARTPASRLPDQIDANVIKRRAGMINALNQ